MEFLLDNWSIASDGRCDDYCEPDYSPTYLRITNSRHSHERFRCLVQT